MSAHRRSQFYLLLLWSLTSVVQAESLPENTTSTVNQTSTNNTISYPSNQELQENQLSWQSAFWAIVAIALTTMADPPGTIYGHPRELTFYLKMSLLTCFFDAMCTIFLLTRLWSPSAPKRSFSKVVYVVAKQKMDLDSTAIHASRGPIRFVLFLFGALPQVVKLASCKGIPFTQAVATCYLASFFLDELIFFFAARNQSNPELHLSPPKLDTISGLVEKLIRFCCEDSFIIILILFPLWAPRVYLWAAFLLSICGIVMLLHNWASRCLPSFRSFKLLCPASEPVASLTGVPITDVPDIATKYTHVVYWVMHSSIVNSMVWSFIGVAIIVPFGSKTKIKIKMRINNTWPLMLLFTGDWLFSVADNSCHQRSYVKRSYVKRELICVAGVLSTSLGISVSMTIIIAIAFWVFELTPNTIGRVALFTVVVYPLTLLLLSVALRKPAQLLIFHQKGTLSHNFPAITHCGLNLLLILVYYRFEYDSTDTYKPGWTEWLG